MLQFLLKQTFYVLVNQDIFQTNLSIHNINKRNKHRINIISYHIISYIISCHIIIISYHIIILYCQGLPKITVRSTICTVALPTKTLHFSVPSPALPPPPQPSLPCFERPTNYVAISRLLKVRNTGNKLSATRTAVYCRRTAALPTPCSSKTHFLSVHRGLFHLP